MPRNSRFPCCYRNQPVPLSEREMISDGGFIITTSMTWPYQPQMRWQYTAFTGWGGASVNPATHELIISSTTADGTDHLLTVKNIYHGWASGMPLNSNIIFPGDYHISFEITQISAGASASIGFNDSGAGAFVTSVGVYDYPLVTITTGTQQAVLLALFPAGVLGTVTFKNVSIKLIL